MTDSTLQVELIALKKEKRKWQAKNNLTQFAHACNAIGEIYSQQGKFEDALEEHEEELSACEKVKDVIGCAVANRKIGECYNELADFEKALTYQHKHLKLAQSVNNAIEEQRAWATIGRTYLCQAESLEHNDDYEYGDVLTKSENAFLKSLDICKSLKKDITQKELMAMKARLYLNMGLIHDYKGNLTKCADLIKQAIHVNEMYDLKEDLNRCQYSLASIYYRSGNCSQALRTVDEAHACAIKLKDISLQSETLLLKSKILLRINDFEGAKYYLKKSYKLNIPNEIVRIEIKKLLKISLDLCRLEKEISILTNDDFNGKMIIYEKLGDLCAKIECFDRSLNFYNKMLECAEVLNISESEKATIYYSLAETYFDLKKFNFAMDFYHKELNSRTGNLKEECKTWLNIAECQFRLKKEFHDLQRSYSHALDCAKEANDIRLQVNCSKNLIRVQEVFNIIDEKIATEKSLEELIKNNNELSEDEDTQNLSQTSSTSELTDLSASSSNSEAENEEFDRPQRKGRKASAKKNEKGETQLHRACITGNINMVRRLIEKGHPVNPRDNCGWIPLHEAANHDHYDIVEYLLGKGAWVNDRGGIHCDGITPLHDAASCANFSIMQLLIEHGASVIAKMNDGQTPLDCLKKWRTRVGEDLEQHLIKEYNEMRDKLQQMTCGVDVESGGLNENQPISSGAFQHMEELVAVQSDEEDEPMERVTRNQLKKRSVTESFSDDDEFAVFNDRKKSRIQDDDGSRSGADSPVDNSEVARHEYRSAIDCVRSATSRINQGEIEPVQRKSEKKLALINEDDVIVDDWLEDDIGPATKSNTVTAWPMFRSGPSGNSGLKSNTSRKTKWKRPKLKQLKFDSLLKSRNEPRRAVDNSEVLEDVECVETVNGDNYQQFAPNQPAQLQTSEYNNFSTGMRVRVRIEGKLLLIPIIQRDSDQSVSWLAEEAANRYHQMFGLRPVLRLCAADGAVLGSNDKITEVIAGGEELLGNTEHWDLPPLNNRYLEACNALKTEPFLNLKHHMEMASISNDLSVLNLCLGPKHLQITFRALQCEYALRHLSLAGNYMGNKGLQMLANILSTLPNLVHLDLSCNNITNLQCLSDIVNKKINAQDIKPLQVLADLNLSYNCLEATVPALSTLLVSLPLLSHLEIACCSLDINIMKKQSSLVKAFADCINLSFLNISFNNFNVEGIAALLQCLRANKITSLDLTSVLSSDKCVANNKLAACLQTFFSAEKCILEDLSLKDCQISDQVVSQIALCLPHLPCINQLSLANNSELSEASLIALTNSFIQNKKLECNVDFSGCMKIFDRLNTPMLTKVLEFWQTNVHKHQLKFKWTSFK